MESRLDKAATRTKRRQRYRRKVAGTADFPRLCVARSSKHISVQAIDDANGKTIASASTQDKDVRSVVKYGGNAAAAKVVGETIAMKLKEKGVENVRFDRGGYLYHGRVKAVADAAREKGLKF